MEHIILLAGSRIAKACALLVVSASILVSASFMLRGYIAHPIMVDGSVDWDCLNRGLGRVHSLSDTWRWWTGTWCGEVPFWRPLTSYVFWGMRLLWPSKYMLPREIIHIILHLSFVAAAGSFLWRLTRRFWLVMLTLWLFAGYRPWPISVAYGEIRPVFELLSDPKNIPDPLAGIAMMLSLALLLNGRWMTGLLAAIASVCFKEIGFTTWPLALLTLAYDHRGELLARSRLDYLRRRLIGNRLAIWAWIAVLAVMMIIHLSAVGVGYRIGNNQDWWWRILLYLTGPVVPALVRFLPIVAATAILEAFLLLTYRGKYLVLRFLLVLVPLAVGMVAGMLAYGYAWDLSLGLLLLPSCGLGLLLEYTIWLLMAWTSRRDWPTAISGLLMCFISVAPIFMAAQTLAHTQYVPSVFMELAVAVAISETARLILRLSGTARVSAR